MPRSLARCKEPLCISQMSISFHSSSFHVEVTVINFCFLGALPCGRNFLYHGIIIFPPKRVLQLCLAVWWKQSLILFGADWGENFLSVLFSFFLSFLPLVLRSENAILSTLSKQVPQEVQDAQKKPPFPNSVSMCVWWWGGGGGCC